MKKTIVIGATTNPERYAYKAVLKLMETGHEVVPVGIRKGKIAGLKINNGKPIENDVDTVSIYLSPATQVEWYSYILSLRPKRVIFNPGTENAEFKHILNENNIETEDACTLVLLSAGAY